MLIPAYVTARAEFDVDVRKEPFLRAFHRDQPFVHEAVACSAWPDAGNHAGNENYETRCADAMFWLFNFTAEGQFWQARKLAVWNRTVPEFMAERAFVGEVDVAELVAAWATVRRLHDDTATIGRTRRGSSKYWVPSYAVLDYSTAEERVRDLVRAAIADVEAVVRAYEGFCN